MSKEKEALDNAVKQLKELVEEIDHLESSIKAAREKREGLRIALKNAQIAYDKTRGDLCTIEKVRIGGRREVAEGVIVHRTSSGKTIKAKVIGYPGEALMSFRRNSYGDWRQYPRPELGVAAYLLEK